MVDGEPMLDGGIVDSIPLLHSIERGHEYNVVISTRNHGYRSTDRDRKTPPFVYKNYPRLRVALSHRHAVYNQQLELVEQMEEEGNAVFLIDDGDAVQGGVFGSLTKGDAIINLMNDVGYDLAIPGNHEFDYGAARFLELVSKADFPYICCNFDDILNNEIVLDSYVIREIGGKRIGFVGALTPLTISSSAPANFKDENGNAVDAYWNVIDPVTGQLAQ
jgi:2',3'-cyclic-nucleotide 2'-phosphodiesterase (5'-nucleotidase family)